MPRIERDSTGNYCSLSPLAVCVGLNRTGTTTFGDAAEILGFSRLGWGERSDCLMKRWNQGQRDVLLDVAGRYQVLEDFPWPLIYRDLAEAFPARQVRLDAKIHSGAVVGFPKSSHSSSRLLLGTRSHLWWWKCRCACKRVLQSLRVASPRRARSVRPQRALHRGLLGGG